MGIFYLGYGGGDWNVLAMLLCWRWRKRGRLEFISVEKGYGLEGFLKKDLIYGRRFVLSIGKWIKKEKVNGIKLIYFIDLKHPVQIDK